MGPPKNQKGVRVWTGTRLIELESHVWSNNGPSALPRERFSPLPSSPTCERTWISDAQGHKLTSGSALGAANRAWVVSESVMTFPRIVIPLQLLVLRMLFSEDRYPPRLKFGAGFFGIMLWSSMV